MAQKLWLRGGIIGAVVCVALFLFYTFIFFPIINNLYEEDIESYGRTPTWTTTIPLLTGHLFVFFSHDLAPSSLLCKSTEPMCLRWESAELTSSGVPMVIDGQVGYCVDQVMVPAESCAELSEQVGFWMFALLLILIYFGLGAAIGGSMQKGKFKII